MKQFNRLSDWIDIESKEEGPLNKRDFFKYNGSEYLIYDFTKIHNNPWFGSDKDFPDYITGVERNPSGRPIFVEIDNSGRRVRLYQEVDHIV